MAISISTSPSNVLCLLLLLASLPAVSAARAAVWATPDPLTTAPQIRNIIEALISAGNFGSWANVLHGTDPSSFPISATLFIPSDDALAHLSSRPITDLSLIQYHITPHEFAFFDLQQFKIGARISTLLPNKTIVITNNTRSNFTVDDSLIIYPDIYNNGVIAVHGIGSVLNSSLYGSPCTAVDGPAPVNVGAPAPHAATPELGTHSDAPCQCTEFPIIVAAMIFVIFAFKIQRGPSR